MRTQQAWQGHPDWRFISSQEGIDHVADQALSIIREFLFRETERKWLLTHLPQGMDLGTPQLIEQFYLSVVKGAELRMRQIDGECVETKKIGSGLSRMEHEQAIDPAVYQAFLPAALGKIAKSRYNVPDGGNAVLSFDIFEGSLRGHITVEREFASLDKAGVYVLPNWLTGALEVTDNPGYKNASLALKGLPGS